jgi:TonB family protein
MNTLLLYVIKVAAYIAAFYLVYTLVLSRDTSYGRNRAFILLSLTSALVFPFFTLKVFQPSDIPLFGKILSEVLVTGTLTEIKTSASAQNPFQLISYIYITGVIIFSLKLFIDLGNLVLLVIRKRTPGTRIIRYNDFHTAGFSALGYIFINAKLDQDEAAEIVKHEQNHVRKHHFLDIIFVELIKILQWFNPMIHLFDRSLRAIHEYQADNDLLNSGMTIVNYQRLLLNQVFKSSAFNLTNSFSNPSLIRKRMIMMTRKPTSAIAGLKLLSVLPVAILVFIIISAFNEAPVNTTAQTENINAEAPPPPPPPAIDEKNQNNAAEEEVVSETPFVAVEEMPEFPGGDIELLKFIAENTVYPQVAKENGIQGRVIVRFCVTKNGGISQASILKGVSPELDTEALRVVSQLPSFKPGKQGGRPVPVWYMVPISFKLR